MNEHPDHGSKIGLSRADSGIICGTQVVAGFSLRLWPEKVLSKGKSLTLVERNIKLIVAYDGSGFFGFQLQSTLPTIQEALERSVELVIGEKARVVGSGRTDTGVHAYGQVASFKIKSPIPVEKLKIALNRSLPATVRVRTVEEVEPSFNARFSSKAKHYRYLIREVDEPDPFLERFFCQHIGSLKLRRMQQGAKRFVGLHDFASFTRSPATKDDTRRKILKAKVSRIRDAIAFDVEGTGFLHNMVRNMAKALILIGSGQMDPDEIGELYRNRDRRRLGAPAPAGGLYLMKVVY